MFCIFCLERLQEIVSVWVTNILGLHLEICSLAQHGKDNRKPFSPSSQCVLIHMAEITEWQTMELQARN